MISAAIKKYVFSFFDFPRSCAFPIFLTILNSLTIGICLFLPIYFFSNLHFNPQTSAFLISFEGMGSIFGGYISGKLCDFFEEKKISTIFLICQGISFYLLSQLTSFFHIAFVLFLLGLSLYGFRTANNVVMLLVCGRDEIIRLKTLNISHVASNLGFGISGILIGAIPENHFGLIFYFASVILFFSSFLQYLKSVPQKQKEYSTSSTSPIFQKETLENKSIWFFYLVLISVLLASMVFSQLSSTYPIYIKESFAGFGNQFVGALFFINTMMILLFQSSLPKWYAKKNTLWVMGLGGLAMSLGTGLLLIKSHIFFAVLSCVFWTLGEMLFIPTAQSMCYEVSPKNKKGTSAGLYQTIFALSMVLGPCLGSWIYGRSSASLLWSLCAVISFLIYLVCWAVVRGHKNLFLRNSNAAS